MQTKQRGVTTLGWLILLIPVALVLYAGIRAVPVYLNYFKVARVIDQVAAEANGEGPSSAGQIRNSIERRLDIESVSYPSAQDIGVTREGRSWVITASYEQTAPLFANVSLLLAFDRTARGD